MEVDSEDKVEEGKQSFDALEKDSSGKVTKKKGKKSDRFKKLNLT